MAKQFEGILDVLTAEEIDFMRQEKNMEKIEKHLKHPLYHRANQFYKETQREQILKGAEKYEEPFTPQSWTPQQLVKHFFQEFTDASHYAVGLLELIEDLEKRLEAAEYDTKYWISRYEVHRDAAIYWKTEYDKLKEGKPTHICRENALIEWSDDNQSDFIRIYCKECGNTLHGIDGK